MTQSFDSSQIKFPCVWHGSLMVHSGTPDVESSIRGVFASMCLNDAEISSGHVSKNGTYVTWKLSCTVPDLLTLRGLFHGLESLPGVRMLI